MVTVVVGILAFSYIAVKLDVAMPMVTLQQQCLWWQCDKSGSSWCLVVVK